MNGVVLSARLPNHRGANWQTKNSGEMIWYGMLAKEETPILKPDTAPVERVSHEGERASWRFHYLPFLDGCRAISILLVLGYHRMGPVSEWIGNLLSGWVGVDMFFVISGFLITSLLVQEQKDYGSFSIKRFYSRRCLRIWPAYYVFLFVVGVINPGRPSHSEIAIDAIYLTNYDLALEWGFCKGLPHLWSLALEEQFYLIWPIVLWFAGKHAFRMGLIAVFAVFIWRIWLLFQGVSSLRLEAAFDTRIDCILFGCLAALLWADPNTQQRIRSGLSGTWVPPILAAALFCSAQTLGNPHDPTLEHRVLFWVLLSPTFTLLFTVFILALIVQPASAVSRVLSNPVLVWIGRLAYSLYLWHAFAWGLAAEFVLKRLLHWDEAGPLGEPLRFGAAILVAAASYYVIERPFLKLKNRWQRRAPACIGAGPEAQ